MTTTQATTVRINSTVWSTTDPNRTQTVILCPEIKLVEPEFVIECRLGSRTIGVLTGRTRRIWGMDCPTIQRYQIDTVVIDGAIWGVRGEPIKGTFAVNPAQVV